MLPGMLRFAQHDRPRTCHAERSEASLADFWGITTFLGLKCISLVVYNGIKTGRYVVQGKIVLR